MKKTLCIFLTLIMLLLTACNTAEPINIESPSESNPESPSMPIEESTPAPEASDTTPGPTVNEMLMLDPDKQNLPSYDELCQIQIDMTLYEVYSILGNPQRTENVLMPIWPGSSSAFMTTFFVYDSVEGGYLMVSFAAKGTWDELKDKDEDEILTYVSNMRLVEPNTTIPEEIEYDFEKGETSVDLARQLKPLMTAHLARITLRSSPDNRVSSIKREHQYILIEGGYVRYSFVAASELIAEMKDKEHVNVLVSAYIQNVDGTKEVLFDISDSEGLCADDIIYGPMVSLDKVAKLEENMTKNEVVALLGDFHVSEEDSSGYYDLEDGRLLYLEYSADTDENLVLVYAQISSAIGGWENFKTEVLFGNMRVSP